MTYIPGTFFFFFFHSFVYEKSPDDWKYTYLPDSLPEPNRVQLLEYHTLQSKPAVWLTLVSFPKEVLSLSLSVLCGGSKKTIIFTLLG